MSKDHLHFLVERLGDDQVQEAERALSELVGSESDVDAPLSAETLAAIEAARTRIRAGEFQTLKEYERERAG